jgi:hydroxyacylglutathione hydrolase
MAPIQIIPVHHSPFNTAKSYLLLGERVVIVDTGPPDRERSGQLVRRALAAAGKAPQDVSLILATHAHPDHVGNAASLRAWTGAPIAADPNELTCFEGTTRVGATPTGLAGRLFLLTPLPHQEFDPFTPDLFVDDHFNLRHFGVAADVYRCGGHTPGSLAVHVPFTGDLLAADLLAGGIGIGGIAWHGRVIEPPFHEDRPGVVRAVTKLLELGDLGMVHVCHGGPLLPRAVEAWITKMSAALHVARELGR